MTGERGARAESKNCEILLFPTADRRFDTKVKCPTGRASFWVRFPTVRSLTRVKCPGIARGGMGGFGIDWYISSYWAHSPIMLKYHHHFVPYYSESPMLFFQIFLALLLRRQPEEVGNNKLEQLEAVFLLICDQESCVRLQCGPGNVSHVA